MLSILTRIIRVIMMVMMKIKYQNDDEDVSNGDKFSSLRELGEIDEELVKSEQLKKHYDTKVCCFYCCLVLLFEFRMMNMVMMVILLSSSSSPSSYITVHSECI